MTLTELLTSEDNKLASLQEEARESIHNNGGGVYNHQLYFDSMRSPVGQELRNIGRGTDPWISDR